MGASLGAVASLSTAFRYPGVFGGLVLQSGSFIFDERKLERRPHPVFHRIARLVRALRRAPQVPEPAPSSRRASSRGWPRRTARLQISCANAASMFCSRALGRPPLAQLARPTARRADVGAPPGGRTRPADGWLPPSRQRNGRGPWSIAPSISACRSGPTSAGRSPTRACSTAWSSISNVGGDRLRFHCERVTIEPFDLRQPVKYDLVIDRLTHWYSTSREWIKKAIVLNDLYVYNNPWSIQSNEKHTSYCAMMRPRPAGAGDLDAAGEGLRPRRRPRS